MLHHPPVLYRCTAAHPHAWESADFIDLSQMASSPLFTAFV